MIRHRKCGCDCRDNESFAQTNTAPCCDQCPDWESPCCWIARFECTVLPDSGCDNPSTRGLACADVYLRPACYFGPFTFTVGDCGTPFDVTIPGGNCKWIALGRYLPGCSECLSCAGANEIGIMDPESNFCSWDDVTTSYVLPPYTRYGYSWVLTLAVGSATLEWDHETYGLLTYTFTGTWDCAGPNTMTLTAHGTLDDGVLPSSICVVPLDRPSEGGCNPNVPCGYTDPADRCDCCDPCCDSLPPQPLFITCGACSESTTVTPTVGGGNGLDGVDSPSGQTYGACATLCGKELCANWYCSSGQWKLDGYVDGDFCGTGNLTHTCCPLTLGTTTLSGCAPSGCDICAGDGCEPPCDCSTLLTDLASVTVSSSGGGSISLPNNVTDWSQLTSLDSLPVTLTFDCVDSTNYTLAVVYEPGNPGYVGFGNYTSASGVCSPLEAVFNNVDLGDGVLKTITVTA